ncbi:MAG: TonB-dependent receptor [Bacteroidetes bacterium]|nr:TonB-dependent receptor [Bacteroidota bacterium]
MIHKNHFILLLLCINSLVVAQTIKGRVLDSTQSPLSFATIALLNKTDSSVLKGSISDEQGNYFFDKISKGNYILKISSVGYKTKCSSIIFFDSLTNIIVPDITVSGGQDLDEVSVTAIRNTLEFKNGNIIVNVESSPLAKGNSVYDLLIKLPGISIDDNIISLNGKPGVVFMLDGRVLQLSNMQLVNMLKSMSTEVVEKIELLKNPPVKYDAAGTSGMIHIKTKKTKLLGFSGSVYSSNSFGFYPRNLAGVSLNYKLSKITLFSNFDFNNSVYQSLDHFNKKFRTDSTLTEFVNSNSYKEVERNFLFKVGADWQIDKKNIIGFKVDGGPGTYASDGHGVNTVTGYNSLGFDHLAALVHSPSNWNSTNYNLNAEHRFDTSGTSLNFTSDYTLLNENNFLSVENLFLGLNNSEVLPANVYKSSNKGETKILATKLDLTKIINVKSSFELGGKISSVQTSYNYLFEKRDNMSGAYVMDTALTNNYTYREQTLALYANYKKSFDKVNVQLGLRGENTNLTGRNTGKNFALTRNYYNLFPNILFEYIPSEKNNFQLNFNRRIDRPDFGSLTPFRIYRDQYSYNQGNPFLLPHYSNTAEFTHMYKQSIANTLTYTRINNVMLYYTAQDDSTKVTTQSMKNMKYNNYYAYSLFMRSDIKKWWNISANGLLAYIEYLGDVKGVVFHTTSLHYNASLTNTFLAPKNTKIEMIVFYRSPKNNGVIQANYRWLFSLAIKKTFLKNKLDCSIGVNDIFYTSVGRSFAKFSNQDWNFSQTTDTRRLVININYNFGRLKVKLRDEASNEEEKSRLSH